MGLSNVAVSRLSQTWERLPGKLKRTFAEFETLIDPSRNHRRYRVAVSKINPPLVPFMPLLLKDMTFCHEGNKTYIDGLVNFEKMHMIGQTLRSLRHSRSQRINLEPPPQGKVQQDVREYIRWVTKHILPPFNGLCGAQKVHVTILNQLFRVTRNVFSLQTGRPKSMYRSSIC